MKTRSLLFLSIIFVLIMALGNSSPAGASWLKQITIPSGFDFVDARPGVELYKQEPNGNRTDYVQVVNLAQGATVSLKHGDIYKSDPRTGHGFYGGDNPEFWRQSIQDAWNDFSYSDNNAFCITNGQFFADENADGTDIDPTSLAFPIKIDGKVISEGYGRLYGETGPELFPGKKLMLEIWPNKANIVPLLSKDSLDGPDSAPNIIVGLTVGAYPAGSTRRTFVAVIDKNDDSTYGTVLVLNTTDATQDEAANALKEFGVEDNKVMMLDGGGSTQLRCGEELYLRSPDDRRLPQTLAVSSASNITGAVDVALIIDSSGSMSTNDPQNQRKAAANVYLSASQTGDRVAIVDFDSTVRLASGLLPAIINGQRNQELVDAINSIDSSGSTNIRDGIDEACQELIANGQANKRGAILLTDGEHNVGAFGTPQQCFIDNNWPIFTFGFGSANVNLLQQIADQTGGEFKNINQVNSLACEFQRVRALIAGVQSQPCTSFSINPFEWIRFFINVLFNQLQITFSTSWTGSDVEMSLISPSGRVIDRNTVAPDVIHDLGSTYEVYTILNPEPGDWEVVLYGADIPAGGEEVIFGYTSIPLASQPPVLVVPGEQQVRYGNSLSFDVSATDPDDPGDTLTFSATGLPNDLVLTDNGDGTATVSGVVNVAPGTYTAQITVTDPSGLSDTKPVTIEVIYSVPTLPVLDDFNRANGSIGRNWSGKRSGYRIFDNQLRVKSAGTATDIYWKKIFEEDQEAYITFARIKESAEEYSLLLKSQSKRTWGDGVLEVQYSPQDQTVQVWTWIWPGGWTKHGDDIPVTFVDGDTFGARARPDGIVEIYRNGELLDTRDITSWPYYPNGGYIGLWFLGARNTVLDDFGGGSVPAFP